MPQSKHRKKLKNETRLESIFSRDLSKPICEQSVLTSNCFTKMKNRILRCEKYFQVTAKKTLKLWRPQTVPWYERTASSLQTSRPRLEPAKFSLAKTEEDKSFENMSTTSKPVSIKPQHFTRVAAVTQYWFNLFEGESCSVELLLCCFNARSKYSWEQIPGEEKGKTISLSGQFCLKW